MAQLQTPYATLSFPQLFAPRPQGGVQGNKLVYSCSLLFAEPEQKSKQYKAMQEAVKQAAIDEFGSSVNFKALTLPFKDAGEKNYGGYEPGMTYISTWSEQKPGVVDNRLQDILEPSEVFAGQTVRALLNPYAWQNTGRKGVSFGLVHIQVVKKDAPRIDGRLPANKAFSAVDDDGDDVPF